MESFQPPSRPPPQHTSSSPYCGQVPRTPCRVSCGRAVPTVPRALRRTLSTPVSSVGRGSEVPFRASPPTSRPTSATSDNRGSKREMTPQRSTPVNAHRAMPGSASGNRANTRTSSRDLLQTPAPGAGRSCSVATGEPRSRPQSRTRKDYRHHAHDLVPDGKNCKILDQKSQARKMARWPAPNDTIVPMRAQIMAAAASSQWYSQN